MRVNAQDRTDNIYWTKETDRAVFRYIAEQDDAERDRIFEQSVREPLQKLIDAMIFKLKIVQPHSTDQTMSDLRSTCFDKFFAITKPGSTYIREERGRPFNFLTTVIKNHLVGYVMDIVRRRSRMTNHFGSEEFVFAERVNHLGDQTYAEIVIDEEDEDDIARRAYEKLVTSLERDVAAKAFKSKKEMAFAENLLVVLHNKDKFGNIGWYNKFFIKLILQEITGQSRSTVNYYLSKIKKRYLAVMVED